MLSKEYCRRNIIEGVLLKECCRRSVIEGMLPKEYYRRNVADILPVIDTDKNDRNKGKEIWGGGKGKREEGGMIGKREDRRGDIGYKDLLNLRFSIY